MVMLTCFNGAVRTESDFRRIVKGSGREIYHRCFADAQGKWDDGDRNLMEVILEEAVLLRTSYTSVEILTHKMDLSILLPSIELQGIESLRRERALLNLVVRTVEALLKPFR